ncbi:MAG TPA: MotA/TolQ/ExbB proton channel family protein [Candidatus Didemnitutus sp.]|nr:MotA/TolQ/ExbB proton channel family protein [Candidatus Didemnitutus sp.]
MKNMTNFIIVLACTVAAYLVFYLVLGAEANFRDPKTQLVDMHLPQNMMGMIYTGGWLVGLLITCILIAITFTVERFLSIGKAGGKGNMHTFAQEVVANVAKGNYSAALAACDNQRGSLANVLRAAVERFKSVENDPSLNADQKLQETQRVVDENMNLETPLLEKNLVMLSTVASVSTMIGLLGTTIGMIKAFQALGAAGTVSAQQLSVGISEALYNTAGGLIAAVLSIIFFNYFTTKVDNFTYQMDEAILDLMETLSIRTGTKA